MLSLASGPAVLRWGNDMVNLHLVSLEIQTWWSGLFTCVASDLVRHTKNTLLLYRVYSAYDIQWALQKKGNLRIFNSCVGSTMCKSNISQSELSLNGTVIFSPHCQHKLSFDKWESRWPPLITSLRVHFLEALTPKESNWLQSPHSID